MGLQIIDTPEKAKDYIQERAVKISEHKRHTLLTWATGCGKTLAALKIIRRYGSYGTNGRIQKWYIICSELSHIENWKREIELHGYQDILEYTEFFCYASLEKYINTEANFVLDECHHLSDIRLQHLSTIKAGKVISLSATVEENIKIKLQHLGHFEEYHISTTEAIQYGLLPEPDVYVVNLELDNLNRKNIYYKKKGMQNSVKLYKEVTDTNNFIKILTDLKANNINDYCLTIMCSDKEYYDLISNDIEYWKKTYVQTKTEWHKTLFLRKSLERKNFLANYKTNIVKKLVKLVKENDNRFICFTNDIKQLKSISSKSNYVCSNKSESENKHIVNKFNSGKINDIYVVDMLRESVTLSNINAGIITQLDSKQLSFVQMMGKQNLAHIPLIR